MTKHQSTFSSSWNQFTRNHRTQFCVFLKLAVQLHPLCGLATNKMSGLKEGEFIAEQL
jgi:hypothetical protein